MNSQIIRDELDALASIFCGDGEFQVVASDEKEVAILVTPFSLGGKHVMLSVMLHSAKYPEEVPKFSVQSNELKRYELSMIEANLKEEAEKFKGEPMILTLVGCLSDSVTSLKPDSINEHTQPSATAIDKNTIILKLDHIRNRQVYVKTLSKWFKELDLTGLLLMHKRVVLLIITGNKNELQIYLKRHRTQNVDVDSAGRPCKERLLTQLGEMDEILDVLPDQTGPLKQVDIEERQAYLDFWKTNATLWNIYRKFIQPQSEQKK